MKGHIVLPEFYRTRWTDDYKHLLAMVASEFKFRIEYSDNPQIAQDTDVVILFAVPHHMRPHVLQNMASLPKPIKVIGYMKDIHHFGNPEAESAYKAMFDRYDVILSSADELFQKLYPDYIGKMLYFPDFFGPHERFELPYNENPTMRCLVSGTVSPDVYPLRLHILKNGSDEYLDYLPGPLAGHDFIGDKYAQLLHSYFCCATCSSVFNYTLAKYWEIPASGSLLIANSTSDLEKLGMLPNVHFVPISFETATETIKKVLREPDRYEAIRQEGTEYVRANHSVRNRFETLKKVIHDCLN